VRQLLRRSLYVKTPRGPVREVQEPACPRPHRYVYARFGACASVLSAVI